MEILLIEYVQNYGLLSILASFLIGVLTALAPCSLLTLPLLVGSAVTLSSDLDEKQKKIFIYKYSALFVLGLNISFSILMLIVAKVGMMLAVAPFWAYGLTSITTFIVVAYSLGWIGSVDKQYIANRFIKYKLYGAIIIGLVFGLVSSPCASAPLVAIITVAEQSGWFYSYLLVLAFALGHALFLLLAGVSIGFTQSIISNKILNSVSKLVNNIFILMLVAIGFYFSYQTVINF
ncbi:Cytochrome c-type biogenesis protein CcdA (DsbD analog) [hydrothermal vent metagenome]|uniref:Cytochrome c-type biogenesis protein CcdA (DsbD analog) n=1 Tax=hydrothermal vent metagenome TaxID=652676 RepID=A0A3B1DW57_9ZZZZ